MSRATYHARWVVPVTAPPIENGRIVVEDGRITSVGRAVSGDTPSIDLGDAVVLPGFVNAHTHLELTACHGRVPYRGSFVEWITDVTRTNPHLESDEAVSQSVRSGLARSMAAGVTAVADIGAGQLVFDAWTASAIHTVGFLEAIGMGADHRRRMLETRSVASARRLCDRSSPAESSDNSADEPYAPLHRFGISPHAPFSTDQTVYREAIAFARKDGRLISTHLAETREEEQFLHNGTGGFRELLEHFGLWDGSFTPPGCSPVRYADRIGLLECDPLLAHVNYATDEDLDLLASSGASVVYCPRSHRFFGHESHRYRDMMARGINVCVGTDSLASNDSLSVLDELRFLRSADETLTDEQLLTMGTFAGARALKLDTEIGSIETGKRADLVALPLEHPNTRDTCKDLLRSQVTPAAVWINGLRLWPATP